MITGPMSERLRNIFGDAITPAQELAVFTWLAEVHQSGRNDAGRALDTMSVNIALCTRSMREVAHVLTTIADAERTQGISNALAADLRVQAEKLMRARADNEIF